MTFDPKENCLHCRYGWWLIPLLVMTGVFVLVDWLTGGEVENIGPDNVSYAGVRRFTVWPR